MTTQSPHDEHRAATTGPPRYPEAGMPSTPQEDSTHEHETGHGGHRWMMIACCIPMLIVVGVLVASGTAGSGAIIYAVVCLGMMWLMMRAMPGGH